MGVYNPCSLSIYYYYIRLLTIDVKINFKWIWILIPAILLSVFSAVLYLMMSPEEISVFTHEVLYHSRGNVSEYSQLINLQILRLTLLKIIFTIEVLLTLYFGLRLIKNYNEKVRCFYSNIENKELSKIKMLLYFLVFTSLVSMISNFIGKPISQTTHTFDIAFNNTLNSSFGVSYVGFRQTFSIRDLTEDDNVGVLSESKRQDEPLTNSEFDKLFLKLEALFNENKYSKTLN